MRELFALFLLGLNLYLAYRFRVRTVGRPRRAVDWWWVLVTAICLIAVEGALLQLILDINVLSRKGFDRQLARVAFVVTLGVVSALIGWGYALLYRIVRYFGRRAVVLMTGAFALVWLKVTLSLMCRFGL